MLSKQKIVVVIPAFNESGTIGKVIEGIKPYVDEIIVVDDGSGDSTGLKAEKEGAIIVNHKKNQGYDSSIEDGFRKALERKASVIVTFDADGQHQPEDIKRLIEPIVTGKADIVIGQREDTPPLSEKILALYTNFRFGIKDPLCGLKAYTSKVYEDIGHFDTLGSMGTQLMMEALYRGFRVELVTINVRAQTNRIHFYFKRLKTSYKILRATIKIILFLRR